MSCVSVCVVLALGRHSSILCDSPSGQEGALNRAAMERRIRTLEDEVSGCTCKAAHRITGDYHIDFRFGFGPVSSVCCVGEFFVGNYILAV